MDKIQPANPRPDAHGRSVSDDAGLIDNFSLPPLLIQYLQAAIRWRLVIAGIVLAAVGVGIVTTLLQAPLFSARSQMEISREQKNVTNVQGVDAATSPYDMEFYDTQYALLKAESLGQRVVRSLKLAEDRDFFAAHGIELPTSGPATGRLSANEVKERERIATSVVLGSVTIAPVRNSRLVDIKYVSRSPQLSAKIANVWPQEFIAANMDRQYASTADARRFLEERLATLRARLEESERQVVTYATDRNIVTLGTMRDSSGRTQASQTLVESDLGALNAALIAARTERIAAESRARTRIGQDSQETIASATISNLRTKRAEVAADYARLLVQFEPGYPAARALKAQMDELDVAVSRETSRIGNSRQANYSEASKRESELASQVAVLKSRFDQQQRDTIQYNIFQREADTNRQLYDALLQRYKEIGIAGTVGAANIVIVDQAKVPTGPSAPSLPKNLAIALLLGLALAGAAVLALEQIDEGIRNPGDIERLLGLPLLGNAPLANDEPATLLLDPKSHLSEAYFSVRTTLALATPHGLPRSLVVTSAQPGEGKSVTSLALAGAVGRTGKRVLLIDADMRSPSVHKLLGGGNAKGLSNLLAGDDNSEALIRGTELKGVWVLPAGPSPPSAAELLSTDTLGLMLTKLLSEFDNIIIDAPPVLGLSDAPLLGRVAEGCVFVIEAERVAIRTIRSALHRLQVGQNHVFGAVITKVDYSRHNYGYGYGSGYGYEYGYGKQQDSRLDAPAGRGKQPAAATL